MLGPHDAGFGGNAIALPRDEVTDVVNIGLSQMRTELVWEGKVDEYGDRQEVDIAGCAMPMQKIESIDIIKIIIKIFYGTSS